MFFSYTAILTRNSRTLLPWLQFICRCTMQTHKLAYFGVPGSSTGEECAESTVREQSTCTYKRSESQGGPWGVVSASRPHYQYLR